jgi:hypothetical protein
MVVEASGATPEATFGLKACAWPAVLANALVALLAAVSVALDAALEVADLAAAAVDSVEPTAPAAVALPVCFTAFVAGDNFGLSSELLRAPWP